MAACPRIRFRRPTLRTSLLLALPALLAAGCVLHGPPRHDVLAMTDLGAVPDPGDPASFLNGSVKFFDAHTGMPLAHPAVPPGSGLAGPAGILFPDGPRGGFLVVNQNVFQPFPGEVRHYDAGGRRLPDYVPSSVPEAPWAPRGAVVVDNRDGSRTLFVADEGDALVRGRLLAYTLRGGIVVDRDNPAILDPHLRKPDGGEQQYHPRAAVLGPDGLLYVTHLGEFHGDLGPGCGGSVMRFDPRRLAFVDVAIENPPLCKDNRVDLHRPEGLAFSPAGDLFVTSYRQRSPVPGDTVDPADNDRILIVPGPCLRLHDRRSAADTARACRLPLDRIDLWRAGQQERAYATALAFGPGGGLYVPISSTGEVRRYDVASKRYSVFIPAHSPGGPVAPEYLSFGRTDPATLAYDPRGPWCPGCLRAR
jgi:hypothetical protein